MSSFRFGRLSIGMSFCGRRRWRCSSSATLRFFRRCGVGKRGGLSGVRAGADSAEVKMGGRSVETGVSSVDIAATVGMVGLQVDEGFAPTSVSLLCVAAAVNKEDLKVGREVVSKPIVGFWAFLASEWLSTLTILGGTV